VVVANGFVNQSDLSAGRSSFVQRIGPWALLLVAFSVVSLPTFIDLFRGLWRSDQNGHGPIVLAVSLWLLWHKSRQLDPDLVHSSVQAPAGRVAGWGLLCFGVIAYALGRSQAIYLLEVGALNAMLAGTVLVLFGRAVARELWFVFFFLLFMIPLPGSLVDAITQPMKLAVSWGSENLLHALGYPVSRAGVVLTVGQYQLLVADACAGLNSLFTLEALGLLYLNVVRHASAVRNVALAILIVPISFCANVTRVIVLALVTYHFGDEAGQGFLHEFSGMVLFLTALVFIISLDGMLRFGVSKQPARGGRS
jgi:exosortase B